MSYVGSTVGSIRIDSQLGAGGMGEVYLGFDTRLERRVAVKTIRPEKRLGFQAKTRFLREARLLSKIGHPSICQVYDLIETPGADFLVLEYVQGTTLRKLAMEELGFERKLRLSEKIAMALAAAHREKVVHRDLKADNVMVTPGDEVKVLDFGIARSLGDPAPPSAHPPQAVPLPSTDSDRTEELGWMFPGKTLFPVDEGDGGKLTQHGVVVGTIYAMSPEQAAGSEVTEATDLYSFGILLQELFTGEEAYEGDDEAEVVWKVMRAETRPIAGLDLDLTRLIQDLQSLDPRRRPTAEQAAERLRWILDKPQRLRRKRFRFAAVVTAFFVLTGVLAVVSWFAVETERARREAERRRKQAESLIGFMLGDLRQRLEAVNRLDVLDAVGDRALGYFDELPEADLTDEEMLRRVQAIHQIGEVRRAQGNLPAALEAFRKSQALARDLVRRDPSDQERQIRLLETYNWVGQALFDQGKMDETLAEWKTAQRLAQEQVDLHPNSSSLLQALATAHHNVGTVQDQLGDLEGALRSYQEVLKVLRRLAADNPGDLGLQAHMAATLAWVSNGLERQGDLAAALAPRRESLQIYERIAAREPGNPLLRQDVATAQGFLASLLAPLGDLETARDLFQSGLVTIEELSAQDPENTGLQRWHGTFHSSLGHLAILEGRPGEAIGPLRTARSVYEKLVAKDATSVDWRLQLGVTRGRLATALEGRDLAAARAEAKAALAILRPLLEEDPSDPTRGYVADAEVMLGRIEAALGNPGEARASWERALAVLEPCSKPITHWKLLSPRAQALLALGRRDEARTAVEQLQRAGVFAAGGALTPVPSPVTGRGAPPPHP
ncbi:MAG TPA: protein kinase [Thermoanaerobaculia bacterium]